MGGIGGTMTKEEATELVDGWVKEWRVYLDGGLHKLARAALIDRITAAAPKRGRPKADATVNGG